MRASASVQSVHCLITKARSQDLLLQETPLSVPTMQPIERLRNGARGAHNERANSRNTPDRSGPGDCRAADLSAGWASHPIRGGERWIQPVELDLAPSATGHLSAGAARAVRRAGLRQAVAVGGPTLHVQGDGGPHLLAGRDRAP